MSVADFAGFAGISIARARQVVASGELRAAKIGSRWEIPDAEALRWSALPSRPMAERIAWAAADIADGGNAEWVHSSERSRVRKRLTTLVQSGNAVAQVQAWMRSRAVAGWWRADAESLPAIGQRVNLSGVARAGLRRAPHELVEGFVKPAEVAALVNEFRLAPADPGRGEVLLRVSEFARRDVPRLMVAADLADHGRSRDIRAAEVLVKEVLEGRSW